MSETTSPRARGPRRGKARGTEETARAYFDALAAHDLDAAAACWQPGGIDKLHGMAELVAPAGVREFFGEAFAAFPDWEFEITETTTEGDRCAVQWKLTGTFAGPGSFQGIEPTGARIELEGCDVVKVENGLVARNDAFVNGMDLARKLGALPPEGSGIDRRMVAATNTRIRAQRKASAAPLESVADGVWVVRGGYPLRTMNVYFVRDGDGVAVFDAGIKTMVPAITAAGAQLGGITRCVLGHAHADHRGAAPGLGVPVYCHPDDRADAEGDGGDHYFDFEKLRVPVRWVMPWMLHHAWDGGPVEIAGTVEEGDEVGEFKVIHLPGHAPGLIGLWRDSDRLALVSDCFYTLDPQTARKGPPRVPHSAFNKDTEVARASIRKLAAMEPAAAWPGHADPVVGDVRTKLEQAAATT